MSRWLIATLRPASAVKVVDAAEVGSANTSANREEESPCNLVGELREDNEHENQEEVEVFGEFANTYYLGGLYSVLVHVHVIIRRIKGQEPIGLVLYLKSFILIS